METQKIKSAVNQALTQIEREDVASRSKRYVAVYEDGTISAVLDQHTWEGDRNAPVVCHVWPWFDSSASKTQNELARREEKRRASAEVSNYLAQTLVR